MTDTVVASRLTGEVTWTFAAPGGTDVQVSDQLRFDGRKLDVKAVSVTGTGRRLEATCEETQG
jgi:head-tail adaptor